MKELNQYKRCDVCGNSTTAKGFEDSEAWKDNAWEYIKLCGSWGFCSKGRDQEYHECIMCQECYETVRDFIKALSGKVRVYHYDMISGNPYERAEDLE